MASGEECACVALIRMRLAGIPVSFVASRLISSQSVVGNMHESTITIAIVSLPSLRTSARACSGSTTRFVSRSRKPPFCNAGNVWGEMSTAAAPARNNTSSPARDALAPVKFRSKTITTMESKCFMVTLACGTVIIAVCYGRRPWDKACTLGATCVRATCVRAVKEFLRVNWPFLFDYFGLINRTSPRSIQPFLRSTRNQPSLFFF